MPTGKLSPLQERILLQLADIEPRWTLTGGGALERFRDELVERVVAVSKPTS